jgi:hypothetical protein
MAMLFLTTQTHTPENRLVEADRREAPYEKLESLPGLKILVAYGPYTEHTLYYVVEANDYDTVE